jgi:hypothetical protein
VLGRGLFPKLYRRKCRCQRRKMEELTVEMENRPRLPRVEERRGK